MAADGCVKLKDDKYKQLSLALKTEDIKHLKLIKNILNFTGQIFTRIGNNSKRNENWNDTKNSSFCISSDQLFDDLAKFNIVPRKTNIYKFPKWLLKHKYLNHFMLGYFDGDGSFYIPKLAEGRTIEQVYFALRGTTLFLTDFRTILQQQCGLKVRTKPIRISSGHGILEYGGNGILSKISNYLYRDATIFLPRKYDLIKHFLPNPLKFPY